MLLENIVNTISHKPIKGIAPNLGHRCIWVRRCTDSLLGSKGSKVKGQGDSSQSPGKQGEYNIFVNIRANFTKIR